MAQGHMGAATRQLRYAITTITTSTTYYYYNGETTCSAAGLGAWKRAYWGGVACIGSIRLGLEGADPA